MKKIKYLGLALALVLTANISTAQKAKVVSAYNYNKAFERDKDCKDLEKGIASIEPATKDVKTMSWAKTWFYGGNLYFNAALTTDESCNAKFPNALDKTLEYYVNAMKFNIEAEGAKNLDLSKAEDAAKFQAYLNDKNTKYGDFSYMSSIMNQKFPYLANAFINKGVEAFQAEDYKKAKLYSESSVKVNSYMGRLDSLGMFNAALASERLEMYDEALALYSGLAEVNYGGPDLYMYMASIYDRKKDTVKKMEVVRKGLEVYPEDANLIKEELSYLLITGQTDEALANFDKAIEKDPDNASLFYNRGLINDQLKNVDQAAADYNKALEKDPTFFDAAYNLGAMYYNLGAEWNNKASSFGLNEQAKYKEATGKANEYFTLARPALEKAHEMDPTDQSTMASLTKIYAIQGEDAKYAAMKKKLQGK